MSPLLNFSNFGDIVDTPFTQDIILSIDRGNDVCELINQGTAYFFYHGGPGIGSSLRSNGSINSGSAGFLDGDSVYTVKRGGKTYVLSRVDGKIGQTFFFRLYRGDGTLVTDELNPLFLIHKSGLSYAYTTDVAYNPETGFWAFAVISDPDPLGYWVSYTCDDGILTQYPYRYKDSEKHNPDDLIFAGTYEDIIPYYSITIGDWSLSSGYIGGDTYISESSNNTVSRVYGIACSVPLKISVNLVLESMLILTYGDIHFYGFDGYWAGYLPGVFLSESAHPPNVDGIFSFNGFGISVEDQFIAVDAGTTYSISEYMIMGPNIGGANYPISLGIVAPDSCGERTFWRMTFDLLDSSVFQISIDYDY